MHAQKRPKKTLSSHVRLTPSLSASLTQCWRGSLAHINLQRLGEMSGVFFIFHLCLVVVVVVVVALLCFELLAFKEIFVKILAEHRPKEQRLQWPHKTRHIVFSKSSLKKSLNNGLLKLWQFKKISNPRKGGKSNFQSYYIIILKYLSFQQPQQKKSQGLQRNRKAWPIKRNKINLQKPSMRKRGQQNY